MPNDLNSVFLVGTLTRIEDADDGFRRLVVQNNHTSYSASDNEYRQIHSQYTILVPDTIPMRSITVGTRIGINGRLNGRYIMAHSIQYLDTPPNDTGVPVKVRKKRKAKIITHNIKSGFTEE